MLDLLPFSRPRGRLAGGWARLRLVHFATSLGLVLPPLCPVTVPLKLTSRFAANGEAGLQPVRPRQAVLFLGGIQL